jgi:O-methyltransferase
MNMNLQATKYIELLKKTLTDYHRYEMGEFRPIPSDEPRPMIKFIDKLLRRQKGSYFVGVKIPFNKENRINGWDWPPPTYADTMIGMHRLNNIEMLVNDIITNNIPGDLVEAGVWRGGSVIFMKALLEINEVRDRTVWVVDSFAGLPKPNLEKYPEDKNDTNYLYNELAISIETVKHNFEKYDLLDDNVKFLKGWFSETLPNAPIKNVALARLDGDMYESTIDALNGLYPKIVKGGYIIIDDYNNKVLGCKAAVQDYRKQHNITDEIIEIDWTGVYWKKTT